MGVRRATQISARAVHRREGRGAHGYQSVRLLSSHACTTHTLTHARRSKGDGTFAPSVSRRRESIEGAIMNMRMLAVANMS